MKIINKLEKIEKRIRDIEQEISDPETVKDQTRYQKLTRELSSIRPVVDVIVNNTFCPPGKNSGHM